MKRRNTECGKLRVARRRSKIPDSVYGSLVMYLKFLLVWLLVLLADFLLEFRFEYLWPFWLLLRSVYDSFKYQGLAFSVFFICISLTSDMICFLFVPVHWLFFAASTYVWVQFVWHTERGICLPTASLWLLFVYIEASVRLREIKNLPFHLDLCRPFAAHCIGYPVVTLGFGFKSYVGYRMRQRKQKEVAKENDFFLQLVRDALPPQEPQNANSNTASSTKAGDEVVSNGVSPSVKESSRKSTVSNSSKSCDSNKFSEIDHKDSKKVANTNSIDRELEYMENQLQKRSSVNDYYESGEVEKDKSYKANGVVQQTTSARSSSTTTNSRWSSNQQQNHNHQALQMKENKENVSYNIHNSSSKKSKMLPVKESTANNLANQKDDHVLRLESDIKRLKADLQSSRQCELDLRSQINSLTNEDRSVRNELVQLQQDNETLQTKLHGLVTARQHDKQTIATLEKKLQEERKCKSQLETQLTAERKSRKAEDVVSRSATQQSVNNLRLECTESCKSKRKDLEAENKQLRRELKFFEERCRQAEREAQTLRQYKDSHNETEVLMSALSAMQDKNTHLETSLSAETRIKLDLFSALGEVKRQVEITQNLIMQKDREIEELKSKVAEVMAVMPPATFPVPLEPSVISIPHFASKFVTDDKITTSTLDPNASVYTPIALGGESVDDL